MFAKFAGTTYGRDARLKPHSPMSELPGQSLPRCRPQALATSADLVQGQHAAVW